MSTALVPYSDIDKMAGNLVAAKLFGITDKNVAISLMLVAQAEGLHPATVAVDYDFIQGKPAKKPTAMLRDFTARGGRVEWHELTDKSAEATFSHPQGGTVRVRWDMEKAKQAGLAGKDMWKKYPAAMLRSRCVSEGLRAVFPGATGGLYTPEEVHDMGPQLKQGTRVHTPYPDDMVLMDPEKQQQYREALTQLIDTAISEWPEHQAAAHCLKILDIKSELTDDEWMQVHREFTTRQKEKMRRIEGYKLEDLKRKANVIDAEVTA